MKNRNKNRRRSVKETSVRNYKKTLTAELLIILGILTAVLGAVNQWLIAGIISAVYTVGGIVLYDITEQQNKKNIERYWKFRERREETLDRLVAALENLPCVDLMAIENYEEPKMNTQKIKGCVCAPPTWDSKKGGLKNESTD